MLAMDANPEYFKKDEALAALRRLDKRLQTILEQVSTSDVREIHAPASFGPLRIESVEPIVIVDGVRGQRERFSIEGIIEDGQTEIYPDRISGSGMILHGGHRLWRETAESVSPCLATSSALVRSVRVAEALVDKARWNRLEDLGGLKDLGNLEDFAFTSETLDWWDPGADPK